jgi:hypothetical protein
MGTGLTAVDGCGRWLGLEVEETIGGDVDESQEQQIFRDLFVLLFGNVFNFQRSLNRLGQLC